jgi:hypothetical protein
MTGMAEEHSTTRKPPPRSEDGGRPVRKPEPSGSAEGRSGGSSARPPETHHGRGTSGIGVAKAARAAMSQLELLTNREAEGIVAIEKNDDGGWKVVVEVVENRRVPNSTDVLAEYDVVLDRDGELTSYSRGSRYVRGRSRE